MILSDDTIKRKLDKALKKFDLGGLSDYPEIYECGKECIYDYGACETKGNRNKQECEEIPKQTVECIKLCVEQSASSMQKDENKGCALIRDGFKKVMDATIESKVRLIKIALEFEATGRPAVLHKVQRVIKLLDVVQQIDLQDKIGYLNYRCASSHNPDYTVLLSKKMHEKSVTNFIDGLKKKYSKQATGPQAKCAKECLKPCEEDFVVFKNSIQLEELFSPVHEIKNSLNNLNKCISIVDSCFKGCDISVSGEMSDDEED